MSEATIVCRKCRKIIIIAEENQFNDETIKAIQNAEFICGDCMGYKWGYIENIKIGDEDEGRIEETH